MKRVKVRIPSGRIVIKSKRRQVGVGRCANCQGELHGTPTAHPNEMKLAKSDKRPSRAYGGYFCGNCTRELFREKARGL